MTDSKVVIQLIYDMKTKAFSWGASPPQVGTDRVLMYGILGIAEEVIMRGGIVAHLQNEGMLPKNIRLASPGDLPGKN